jgi:hypothetical protein
VNLMLVRMPFQRFESPYLAAFLLIEFVLLLLPAYRLFKTRQRGDALTLFRKASYYPLTCLILVTVRIMI